MNEIIFKMPMTKKVLSISVGFLALVLCILKFPGSTSSFSLDHAISEDEDPAVTDLRTYLRFRTDHPSPTRGYEESIQFLREQAEEIGLNFTVLHMEAPDLFAVCITWEGTNPGLKSILLNSHMDVVPAGDLTKWTHSPFAAYKDAQGRIYARGATDMKSKTIAELHALRRLKLGGFQPLRTIHMTVMPDEETGGLHGMKPFVQTEFFRNLNVGIDIDEGAEMDNTTKTMYIAVAEKVSWIFNITARGHPGHSSSLPRYTAPQRLQVVIDKLLGFRQLQYLKMIQANNSLDDVTTINLVRLGGGVANNAIPGEVWATFDMRILVEPNWTFTDVDNMLNNILKEASIGSTDSNENVTINFLGNSMETGRTIADDSNPWWTNVQKFCHEINFTCKAQVKSAGSDGRYVRNVGIDVFGLSPFVQHMFHVDNEYVTEDDYLGAIAIYEMLIRSLAMEPGQLAELQPR